MRDGEVGDGSSPVGVDSYTYDPVVDCCQVGSLVDRFASPHVDVSESDAVRHQHDDDNSNNSLASHDCLVTLGSRERQNRSRVKNYLYQVARPVAHTEKSV